MNIAILTSTKSEARIGLNWNFDVRRIVSTILNDSDFVSFEIFDPYNTLMLTTYYPHVKKNVVYIKPVKVVREIIGVPSNTLKLPFLRRKVYWRVNDIRFIKRKRAFSYVYVVNRKTELKIEWFVDCR